MFKENLPKKGHLSREFWTQKPTHMGSTYPYLQHVMLRPGPRKALSNILQYPMELPRICRCDGKAEEDIKTVSWIHYKALTILYQHGFPRRNSDRSTMSSATNKKACSYERIKVIISLAYKILNSGTETSLSLRIIVAVLTKASKTPLNKSLYQDLQT